MRFGSKVYFREVASTGKNLPTKRAGKTRRHLLGSELLTPTGAGTRTERRADELSEESSSSRSESPVLSFEAASLARERRGSLDIEGPSGDYRDVCSAAVVQ